MRRRWRVRLGPVALAALAAGGTARAGEDGARWLLRAELGAEYDSNAHRTERVKGSPEPPQIVDSTLARGVITASLADAIDERQDVALAATVGGKMFWDSAARDEDVAVAQSAATWRLRLARRSALSLAAVYYEAFQRGGGDDIDQRDFRSLTPSLRLAFALGDDLELGAAAGWRQLVFKPDRDFDFTAPTAAIDLRWARETEDGTSDWEATLGAAYEHRTFGGPALTGTCETLPGGKQNCFYMPIEPERVHVDDFMLGRFEVTRTGRTLLGAGYTFNYNRSNSYGATVLRHFVSARVAAALPFDLYLAARGDLLFASYPKGTIAGQISASGTPFTSIEDGENQSSARVDLSRNLNPRVQLLARYTLYAPALGTAIRYYRNTVLLSLAFTIE